MKFEEESKPLQPTSFSLRWNQGGGKKMAAKLSFLLTLLAAENQGEKGWPRVREGEGFK